MDTQGISNNIDTRELLFLVAKFLDGSPCQGAAEVLRQELVQNGLLPTRKTWLGEERQVSYQEAEVRAEHAQSTTLPFLCSKLLKLVEKHGCASTSGPLSLLGSRAMVSLGDHHPGKARINTFLQGAVKHRELTVGYREQPTTNYCLLTSTRQLTSSYPRNSLCGPNFYRGLKKHCSIIGHLAPVFCVLFDHTGERVITGADDELIKIWCSRSGQLLATLRGHSAQVCDLSISYDNTMIASGSLDKSVRVWCAQTSTPMAVLIGHQNYVTSVQFSPSSNEEYRYLASTGKDGFVCFWQWLPDSSTYHTTPIKFMEKNRMGDQTLCSGFSPGGKYFVTGGTDKLLRVYICNTANPILMTEVPAHSDRIMTVQFGHTGESLLATGSCDGTASIWRFAEEGWKCSSVLRISDEEMSMLVYKSSKTGKSEKPQVTMVGWEKTDHYLITAFSPDCHVRVWSSSTGALIRKLECHTGEVFVLEPHPLDSRILLTAGHDGLIVLWDMLAGIKLTSFKLEPQDQDLSGGVERCIFDCKFSPDGTMCAAADSHAYLSLFGFGSSSSYRQFFHTDYNPLIHDRNHYVVDEQTQLPPHTLPPPYLVDMNGTPYSTQNQEAIKKLFRPPQMTRAEHSTDYEDYDEYMRDRVSRAEQRMGLRRSELGVTRRAESAVSRRDGRFFINTRSINRGSLESSSQANTSVVQAHDFNGDLLLPSSTSGVVLPMDTSPSRSNAVPTSHQLEPRAENNNLNVDISPTLMASTGTRTLTEGELSQAIPKGDSSCERPMNGSTDINGGTPQHVCSPLDERGEDGAEPMEHEGGENVSFVASGDVNNVVDQSVRSEDGRAGDGVGSVGGGVGDGMVAEDSVDDHDVRSVGGGVGDDVGSVGGGVGDDVGSVGGGVGDDVRSVGSGVGDDVGNGENDPYEAVEGGHEEMDAMMSSLVYSMGLGEEETKEAISLWLNRTIIPRLDPAQLGSDLARRRQLCEEEQTHYEEMLERGKEVAPAEPIPVRLLSPKGRSLRSGRTILSSLPSSSTPSAESSGSESLLDVWEDSSTDSGDVSDWTAAVSSIPPGRKRTRRQRRLITVSDDEESDEGSKEGEEDENMFSQKQDEEQNTSRSASPPSKTQKVKSRTRSLVYSRYFPPNWIKQTSPKLSPYLPQVGDIVIYCRQGHELYLNHVKEHNIYHCKNVKAPWLKYHLLAQERCQVTNVRYSVGPPTLCSISLALLSSAACPVEGGSSSTTSSKRGFSFKYHDMDDVLDFLILESVFQVSTERTWEAEEQFQSLIDGTYWKGTVLERTPFSKDLPNSYWQCYNVQWEDGVNDQLSPWDMHPVDSDLSTYIEQVLTTPTTSMEQEWGGAGEPKRILDGIEIILGLDEAHMFREPVNLETVPSYCTVVPFPTDLGTIKERLTNHLYRRKTALLWEVVQMWRNVVSFNREDSLIVEHCKVLVHMLWKFINSPELVDPMSCYEAHPVGEVRQEVVVTPPLVELPSMEHVIPPGSSPPSLTITDPPQAAAPWLAEAEELLSALSSHQSSGPFLQPVNTNMYKDYLHFISTPMDLCTAQENLHSGLYHAPKDFISDLRLIFKNAKIYNKKGSVVYKMATDLQVFFEQLVLNFLKLFPGQMHIYGTRNALRRAASSVNSVSCVGGGGSSLRSSCSSLSEVDLDSIASDNPPVLRTNSRLRAKRALSQSSDSGSEMDINGKAVFTYKQSKGLPPTRVTRKRSKAATRTENYGGYKLRSRSSAQRVQLSDSEESEEEKSIISRQSEEEEAYLEELDSEDPEDPESPASVASERKQPRRSTRHGRKRLKMAEYPDESDEETLTTISRSRSGRIVKPIMKFS